MSEKQPTVKLWSVKEGRMLDFTVSVENGEIVCTHVNEKAAVPEEFVKFPGGINKEELLELVKAHNEANRDVKAITPEEIQAQEDLDAANQSLLDSLK